MKVLVCIPCLLTGGTEIQTLSLVKALVKAGHTVTTVCYFEHAEAMVNQYAEAGSRVVRLSPEGRRPQGVWATMRFLLTGLRRVVKAEKPDVAHVQYMAPGAIPIVLLRLLGVRRIIATAHTAADIYSSLRLPHWLQRHVLTAFTCITRRAEASFFGTSQLYAPEVELGRRNHFTIYNNLPDYMPMALAGRSFQQSQLTIGVVSRLEPIKGMDLVMPAFAQVVSRQPEVRLLVVGDGSLRQQMETQCAELGLTERVDFLGRQKQEDLCGCYDRIDLLWMPSRSEGFGLTALEAMARGCVVVAADVGGLPEVVADAGVFHRAGDADDLTDRTCRLLADRQRMTALSSAAIERSKMFSTTRYQQLIASLYQKLM
jgi:glycosyltransferase involved in cell wall biosynthesis